MNYRIRHRLISFIYDLNIKGSGFLCSKIINAFTPKAKNPLVIKTLYGFQLKIDPVKDNGIEKSIYEKGTYEKGTLHIIRKLLTQGDLFVDIGANIGLMSIFAANIVKENGLVVSFEPNPETNQILKENISLNNISNIKVEPYALGNECEQRKIYDNFKVNRGAASLIHPQVLTQSYDVNVTTFSKYFDYMQNISLIKIDVEGYELKVLEGAKGYLKKCKKPPMIIVEFSLLRENSFGEELNALASFIQSVGGYRLFKSVLGKERISKLIEITNTQDFPIHDNVYCFTNEHIAQLEMGLFKKNPLRKSLN